MSRLVAVCDLPQYYRELLRVISDKMQHIWWSQEEVLDVLDHFSLSTTVLEELVIGEWIERDGDDAGWYVIARKSRIFLTNETQTCCYLRASSDVPLTYLGFSAELYRLEGNDWIIRVLPVDVEWIRSRLASGLYYKGEVTE